MDAFSFPQKTRELHNHHFDSTVWNDFRFRDDDIVIATYGKSGTTWTQQIVGQLIFAGAEGVPVHELSPWLDLRVPPKEVKLAALEAQKHRRFIKTHLPVDALVFNPLAKYIYVGRDGSDGASTTTTAKRTPSDTKPSMTRPAASDHRSIRPIATSSPTSDVGLKGMAIPSGRCGRMSEAGGPRATCRMSYCFTTPT